MFTEAQKLRISLLEVTTLYQQKSKFFIYVEQHQLDYDCLWKEARINW